MKSYDLIIIGGGAGGLMAGIKAKDKGLDFIILEKKDRVGVKLGITGKGRGNITNYITDINTLVNKYTHNGKFLYSSLLDFGPEETYKFFENRLGIPLKTERGRRVFPKSNRVLDIVNAFYNELKENILLETEVEDLEFTNNTITKVITNSGELIAKKYLLTTGGKTYPLTGSTGDGYLLAKKLGHTINPTYPVLIGFKCKESFVNDLAGLTLKNVEISVIKNNSVFKKEFGDAMFTHDGISGPIILELSQYTYDMYKVGFKISIDLKPKVEHHILDERFNKILRESGNIFIKNALRNLLPNSLIPIVLENCNITEEKSASQITKEERKKMIDYIKNMEFSIYDNEGWERAVVNTGGIDIKEIDPRTMQSKIINNLYFTGDIIDTFGPTGGFNLQIAWSTAQKAI